jgi:superfamily I DNA and/or RNA helicase
MNKQKRHIPIRQLMLRAGNALVALKPCFMMGPLSGAQYLAPGQIKFDLVLMDEASQLKPKDAIGALARGGQVAIVGDPKQLPPTTFFQRAPVEAEDDEDSITAVEEGESILDVARTLFQPVRRLRWHHQSRHHSLIAFSNDEFPRRFDHFSVCLP